MNYILFFLIFILFAWFCNILARFGNDCFGVSAWSEAEFSDLEMAVFCWGCCELLLEEFWAMGDC